MNLSELPTVRTAGLDVAARGGPSLAFEGPMSERSNRSLSLTGLWHAIWRGGYDVETLQAVWKSIENGQDPYCAKVSLGGLVDSATFHPEIILCFWAVACDRHNGHAIQYLIHRTPRYLIPEAIQIALHFKWRIACMALAAHATRSAPPETAVDLTEPLWASKDHDFLTSVVRSMLDLPCIFDGILHGHLQVARAIRRGPVWAAMQQRTRRHLNVFAAAALIVIAWKRFTAHMCHPDSRYVAKRAVAWGQNK